MRVGSSRKMGVLPLGAPRDAELSSLVKALSKIVAGRRDIPNIAWPSSPSFTCSCCSQRRRPVSSNRGSRRHVYANLVIEGVVSDSGM